MHQFFLDQARMHPSMQPQDALKMAYQAAFGAEHLAGDPLRVRSMLQDELSRCPAASSLPLTESIAPDICRVNLAAWKHATLPADWLAALFLQSCAPLPDGPARMEKALGCLDRLAASGSLPFSAADWQREKQAYLAGGIRPLHHSDRYRQAEAPAYRVLTARFARPISLMACLDSGVPVQIIALDGRCASGKTTLAADFAEAAGASVIHTDDFFLPREMRTPERLNTPGGNVHYERLLTDVLPCLREGRDFSYSRFDCSRMALGEMRQVSASRLYIVEGAYSCHPALGDYMTLRVFSDVSPLEQQRRILLRNGEEGWQQFRARWIPLEETYFNAYGIREKAQVIL